MGKSQMLDRFLVSGHRGYSAKYPENTLLSFQAAIELGVDMLEFDLRLSADNVIMVMHDPGLERTTNGSGPLAEKTCAELKTLDAGGWKAKCFEGLKIPTFEELLELVRPCNELLFSVEIKADARDVDCADAAIAMTEACGVTGRCLLTSFNAAVTDHIHDQYGLPTLGYREKYMQNLKPDSISKLWAVGVPMEDVSREHMAGWRSKGIYPCAFCPDTAEAFTRCVEAGAAMVTCNDPVPALRLVKR